MKKKFWYLTGLLALVIVMTACGTQSQITPSQPVNGDSLAVTLHPTPTPALSIAQQVTTPTPKPTPRPDKSTTKPNTPAPAGNIPTGGAGPAPYGQPPAPTALEIQLTQKLWAVINSDRAARGLYPFSWNATLAGGARLHSWNMVHCGFSHTCPDGENQCTRIANEEFAGYSDCGECIGEAGPASPIWTNIYEVQESMINEPPDGWHRIHLTSTTLHRVGVGIYLDSEGRAWFTEDMVS